MSHSARIDGEIAREKVGPLDVTQKQTEPQGLPHIEDCEAQRREAKTMSRGLVGASNRACA